MLVIYRITSASRKPQASSSSISACSKPRQRARHLVKEPMLAELSNLKNECCATVDRLAAQLIDISHRIHATPELAFNEYQAASLLAETARAGGLDVEQGAFGLETAFSAEFGQ